MFKVNDRVRLTSEGLNHVKIVLPDIFKVLEEHGDVEGQISKSDGNGTITLILPGSRPDTCITLDLASDDLGRYLEAVADSPIELNDAAAADDPSSYAEQMAAQQPQAVQAMQAMPLQPHGPVLPRQTPVPVRVQFAHQVFQHFIGLKQYTIAHSMERASRGQHPVAPGDEWKNGQLPDAQAMLDAAGPLTEAERDLYDEACFKMRQWISQKD